MKPTGIWLGVVIVGMAGCGYKAKIDYARADYERIEPGDSSDERRASQLRLRLEVAADLDRERTTKPTDVAPVAAAEQPAKSQPIQCAQAVTIFNGGIHFHGDTEVHFSAVQYRLEPGSTQATRTTAPVRRPDERCQRLQQEHEERVADWRKKFE